MPFIIFVQNREPWAKQWRNLHLQSYKSVWTGAGQWQTLHSRSVMISNMFPNLGLLNFKTNDFVLFVFAALPKVMINVRTSVQTVMVGNSVEFECHAIGDPEPTVRWSKVGASLPDHVEIRGNLLRIDNVVESDSGQYRCTATNNVGSEYNQVVLKIQCEYNIISRLFMMLLLPLVFICIIWHHKNGKLNPESNALCSLASDFYTAWVKGSNCWV